MRAKKICLVSRPLPRCVAGGSSAIGGIAGEANGKPSAPRSRGLRKQNKGEEETPCERIKMYQETSRQINCT